MEKNDFKALPDELKPREQLRRAASPRDVSEESLLAILLKTGANGCDVVELARRLLKAFGSLHALVRADGRQLERTIKDYNRSHPEKRILGIGPVKALELTAAFELVRRGFEPKADDVRLRRVTTSEDAYDVFKRGLALGDEQENFYVLPLDAKSHPLCETVRVTRGTLDRSPVHVREVFKDAIKWGAHAVMVAHNHPSGDPTPSAEDIVLTRCLVEASAVVGIPLVDHLVLGNGRFASLRERGDVAF